MFKLEEAPFELGFEGCIRVSWEEKGEGHICAEGRGMKEQGGAQCLFTGQGDNKGWIWRGVWWVGVVAWKSLECQARSWGWGGRPWGVLRGIGVQNTWRASRWGWLGP